MRPDTSRWRTDSAYDFMDHAGVDHLAWECLRRNADYQKDYRDLRRNERLDKPLPERLAFQITRMEAHLAQIKSVKTAVDGLYAVLTNEQKAVADDIVLPLTGLGMGRGQGRHMMRW